MIGSKINRETSVGGNIEGREKRNEYEITVDDIREQVLRKWAGKLKRNADWVKDKKEYSYKAKGKEAHGLSFSPNIEIDLKGDAKLLIQLPLQALERFADIHEQDEEIFNEYFKKRFFTKESNLFITRDAYDEDEVSDTREWKPTKEIEINNDGIITMKI